MKVTPLFLLKGFLTGKKIRVKNRYNRVVVLQVEDVKKVHHSVQITPDTQENDWWGQSQDWDMIQVDFTDGSSLEFSLEHDFEIVD